MDWTERMNRIMDYVEHHLCGNISENEIARIAVCPYSLFAAAFSQITGIPFAEYVRRRRLTCAAYDLQNTEDKIIDIAVKYGYQSADAFRVAFKNLHHATPTMVRKDQVKLTFYCRLHFEIVMKGVEKMEYTIMEREAFKVLGIRRITPYGGGTWAVVKGDGSNGRIQELSGRFFDLGLCFGFGEDGSNDYMCAVEWEGDEAEGFESFSFPPAVWLIFEAKGRISDHVLGNVWKRINQEFLPNSKYVKCMATIEKYVIWNEAEDYCHVEIQIPVKLKKS